MNITLKQAAQQAIEAFDAFGDADDFATMFALTQKMNALRTALQQAESEPVAWIRRHPNGALSNELLIHVQVEQVRRDSGAWVPLYTHPAPGVPDDVVRDAISTVREQYRGTDLGKAAEGICDAIDAAMLAAQA